MTQLDFQIEITIGGALGWLPGSGLLLDTRIGQEIAKGIEKTLREAFRQQGIRTRDFAVTLRDAASAKQTTYLATKMVLALQVQYTLLNHDQIIRHQLKGWKKLFFITLRPLIPDMRDRVEQAIARTISDQMHAALPDQVIEGLEANSITVLEVSITSDEIT